ncbi:MAG: UDP-N-acetylmuramate--L-alanine ligase [Cyanobacteria bacterium QS_8_64_29]|nr:MAG: UDP-N-acetylmuramate--L-alanine ligase [Cyanobacteria bacterium QS_8_64_29]
MSDTVDLSGRPFHFIGIGGIGMSALAYILAQRQFPVSGSDLGSSRVTQRLKSAGVRIFEQQAASNLAALASGNGAAQPPQVVCSSAIASTNHEYDAALQRGCAIWHRSDVLAALANERDSIAVAGTHGKTTTSSAIGHLLLQAGLDPTIAVGGEVETWGGNARLGQGRHLVAEADESDGTLAKLHPQIGVVTNIALDHPDRYASVEAAVQTFATFARQCQLLVGCLDCEQVRTQLRPQVSYSLSPQTGATYTATDIACGAQETTATVWERDRCLGQLRLQLLGQHNLSNGLAAVAVGRQLGLSFATIAEALGTFAGTKRRFEHRGCCNGIDVFDDYAHHPNEIRATLAAARLRAAPAQRRVVAVFQPHRYSRAQALLNEFGDAFADADVVAVTDVYGAGEAPGAVEGDRVAEAIAACHPRTRYHPTLAGLSEMLTGEILQAGDLVILLAAGNLNQIVPNLLAQLEQQQVAALSAEERVQ